MNYIIICFFFSLSYIRIHTILELRYKLIFSVVLGGLIFNACSTKKDAFLNRNYNAVKTKYNILYNGNIAFETGREELNASYKDDYWNILPVERLEVTDEIKLDSEDNNPNFVVAEEKATKAIQKHSMDIKNEERNPQTDEAFLLLGKARYFDQRYIPALEAFNYVIKKYNYSDKLNEAHIWREKVNIRLENEEVALENLKRLMKFEDLKDQEEADARAMMAQAYINLKVIDTAIQQLKIASYYTKKKPEKGRYYYIIGQLYNELGHKDSANYAFDKVIDLNRKSPRVYMINAEIQKLRNTQVTNGNKEEILEYLTDLEENRENRPFLHRIYRQIAEFHLGNSSDSLALMYFNKSLRATQNEEKLNALNYENLAEYNFDKNNYKIAGAYYDSMLTNVSENTKKYRAVKKKLDNLEDVIKYEDVVHYADSVITLYSMSKDEQVAYFQKFIDKMKAAEEAAKKKEDRSVAGFASFGDADNAQGQDRQGKFYFYNLTTVGYGKNDFTNKWGNRELEDDWRWSNKSKSLPSKVGGDDVVADAAGDEQPTDEEKYDTAFYVSKIPQDKTIIDSLHTERNFANYQLGLIYKEKFKENKLAAEKLENVLKSNPEERLVLPSKYNLYKIYEEEGSALQAAMKTDIINNHRDSRYAEILLNPQAVLADDSDSPEAQYGLLYEKYRNQEYLKVITAAEVNINKFIGDPIVPKFEMLKANAIGRLNGFELFKEALNYVALTYPNNPEGKKAETMIAEQLPKLEKKEFVSEEDATGGNWKVVFPFKRSNDEQAVKLKKLLEKSIKDLNYTNVVSKDIYTLVDQFVVVHGFKSKSRALGYAELLEINKDYKVKNENFVILSANYKIVQVHKNLEAYKNSVSPSKQ